MTLEQREFASVQSEFLLEPVAGDAPHSHPFDPPTLKNFGSQLCTAGQCEEQTYADVCAAIGEAPRPHRKQWEFVYIYHALVQTGALHEGARGLGFGVGQEPLPAAFVARGAHVVATDLSLEAGMGSGWVQTDQHHGGLLDKLQRPHVCDPDLLAAGVTLRDVDMNFIPDDLRDFDFCWSSCALEHVGSIHRALRFIELSMEVLKPGGVAVHTTELNLESAAITIDHCPTVIPRRDDLIDICGLMAQRGFEVWPLNFHPGSQELDRHIDVPPYSVYTHLKLLLGNVVTSSFGLCIRKPADNPGRRE